MALGFVVFDKSQFNSNKPPKMKAKYKDVLKPPAKVKILKTLVSSFKLPFTTLYMTKNFVKHILYEMALWPSTVQIHLDWRILPKQRQKLIKFGPRDGFTSNAKNLATLFIGQHLQCRLLLAGGEIRDFSQACGGRIVFEPNRAWRCFCYPEMSQVCKLSNLVWGGRVHLPKTNCYSKSPWNIGQKRSKRKPDHLPSTNFQGQAEKASGRVVAWDVFFTLYIDVASQEIGQKIFASCWKFVQGNL